MNANCHQCHIEFKAQRSTAKFCSDKCKLQFSRQKEKVVEQIEQQLQETPEEAYQRRLKGFLAQLDQTEWLKTGTPLDEVSEIPKNKLTIIYGKWGIGKTTLAHKVAANVKNTLYIDTEASVTPERLAQLNIEPKSFTLKKLSYVEEIYELLTNEKILKQYDLIVWDSVAGTSFITEVEGDAPDRNMGVKASIINKMMRVLPNLLDTHKTTLILINQEREGVGQYAPNYMPGGKGQVYSASLIFRLTGDYPKVTVEVKKSRVGETKKEIVNLGVRSYKAELS